jgi:hypothetical protein
MANGNRKTTMAKLNRERKLRERRLDKQARKDARKHAPPNPEEQPGDVPHGAEDQSGPAGPDGEPALAPVVVRPRIDV